MTQVIIVGIGGYGRTLIDVLLAGQEHLDFRLAAAADSRLASLTGREQAVAAALQQSGVELFDDALKMFDAWRGKAQAAYVATGIPSHEPLAVAAMQAGFHLHLEKPPAATIQEVDRMLRVARGADRMVLVGFQAMHRLDLQGLKQRILAGRLGRIEHLACWAGWPRARSYFQRNPWAGRLRSGRRWVLDGPATNALAHQIANLLYLCGPDQTGWGDVDAVRAELYAAQGESHDTAAIEITTAQGPRACFMATHCGQLDQYGPTILIQAQRGSVTWSNQDGARITYGDGTSEHLAPDRDQEVRRRMVENLVRAVQADDASRLRCPLEQARKMVLAIDAAHESSRMIHRIAGHYTQVADAGADEERTWIMDIDPLMESAARRPGLFSDLPGPPPWSVRTQPFTTADYRKFPQRFKG